tara:strand:+ start:401 stop:907 length:507 start_codon:yes stop_codon:yes gene_type:complete
MKIQIAFYKGKGNWLNRLICWWTKSRYSHAELVLPDNKHWIGISPFLSSKVESRIKTDCNIEEWDFVDFKITEEQLKTILAFFKETKECRYDWIGMLLSQFLPFHIKRKNKWYCSEWIAYALRISNVVDWQTIKIYDQSDLSPGTLHTIIMKQKRKNDEQNMENQSNL